MVTVTPSYSLEQSICSYLLSCQNNTGSLLSGSTFTAYTGIGNVDVIAETAIIVDCSDAREVVPFSRNYEWNTKVMVKEIAADVQSGSFNQFLNSGSYSLGQLAGSVFNEFTNNLAAPYNFSDRNYNIGVWSVQIMGMTPSVAEDALVNTIDLRIVGAQIPSE